MSKKHLITVIGNVASGKTTAVHLLKDQIGLELLDLDTIFQAVNPFQEMYLQDLQRWSFANELYLTQRRIELIRKYFRSNSNAHTIIDSGLLMSLVYTSSHSIVGNMTKEEWQLYQDLFDTLSHDLPKHTLVVYLSYSMPTLLKRLTKRHRGYEMKYYKKEYLEQLEKGLDFLVKKLQKEGVPILKITEKEVADFVESREDEKKLVQKVQDALG